MATTISYPYDLQSNHPLLAPLRAQYEIMYNALKASEKLLIEQAKELKERITADISKKKSELTWNTFIEEADGWKFIKSICTSSDEFKEGLSLDYTKDKNSRKFKVLAGHLVIGNSSSYHMNKGLTDKKHCELLSADEIIALEKNLIPEGWDWGN